MKRPVELIKPESFKVHEDSDLPYYGKFIIEPLERGFGITLGNALRRVLLSSIPGYAITEARIEGAPHEFVSLPGVLEDGTEIVLNLKGVRFRLKGDGPFLAKIEKKGPAEVKASDIKLPDGVGEVANPDHHILTLTNDRSITIDLKIEKGRGYAPVEYQKGHEPGIILIDGIFSPITKVNFTVTQARVGKSSDYDRLVLEIWTDGTIDPKDALAYSARVLIDQFSIFTGGAELPEVSRPIGDTSSIYNVCNLLNMTIEELELSGRAYNCLKSAGINFVGELVKYTESELLKLRSFGKKSLDEIVEKLSQYNLKLGMKEINWKPPRPVS